MHVELQQLPRGARDNKSSKYIKMIRARVEVIVLNAFQLYHILQLLLPELRKVTRHAIFGDEFGRCRVERQRGSDSRVHVASDRRHVPTGISSSFGQRIMNNSTEIVQR